MYYYFIPVFLKKIIFIYLFYWSVIALQHHVSFCCKQRASAMCIHTFSPSWISVPTPSHGSRSSQSSRPTPLLYSGFPSSLSCTWKCMYVSATLSFSHPLLPAQCSQVCSLPLRLHSCPANRYINTIFLDSV